MPADGPAIRQIKQQMVEHQSALKRGLEAIEPRPGKSLQQFAPCRFAGTKPGVQIPAQHTMLVRG
jgi:hypothetical protein